MNMIRTLNRAQLGRDPLRHLQRFGEFGKRRMYSRDLTGELAMQWDTELRFQQEEFGTSLVIGRAAAERLEREFEQRWGIATVTTGGTLTARHIVQRFGLRAQLTSMAADYLAGNEAADTLDGLPVGLAADGSSVDPCLVVPSDSPLIRYRAFDYTLTGGMVQQLSLSAYALPPTVVSAALRRPESPVGSGRHSPLAVRIGGKCRFLVPAYARVCIWPASRSNDATRSGADVEPDGFADPTPHRAMSADGPYVLGDSLRRPMRMIVADLIFEDEKLPPEGSLDLMG